MSSSLLSEYDRREKQTYQTADKSKIIQRLAERDRLAQLLENDPYSISLRIRRSEVYQNLGYPDLAVMDAYKALLLMDEVSDETAEYHEAAVSSVREYLLNEAKLEENLTSGDNADILKSLKSLDISTTKENEFYNDEICAHFVEKSWRSKATEFMTICLIAVGCLRTAGEYSNQMLLSDRNCLLGRELIDIQRSNEPRSEGEKVPNKGFVRREVYPWNLHETERHSEQALELLNHEISKVAPKLEVLVTELPALDVKSDDANTPESRKTIRQLGVFAKEDIKPGEEILRERSLLTGNSRLHEPLCDACSAELPSLDRAISSAGDRSTSLVPCEDCDDVIFCSEECHGLAQSQYHPAVCGMEVDAIGKETEPSRAADSLYTLLLFRALAMAKTQDTHPLDLKEVKYIWGDFTAPPEPAESTLSGASLFAAAHRTLPFSFEDNVLAPLHVLEMMEIDIFADPLGLSEMWVWNTLYAKFRGTASARISPRDGRPEVAAVHPLWCLANHSCDPNVQWEWAGEIRFAAREQRIPWRRLAGRDAAGDKKPARNGGIRKGDEILNHYVDIELPVRDRQEWGVGALGGFCRCDRCVWESSDE